MLAYCYAEGRGVEKNLKVAHESVDMAIKECPSIPNFWDTKGELYLMEGDKENARRMYDKCIELNSQWAEQRTNLYIGLFGQ